jgi:hypothetical protein
LIALQIHPGGQKVHIGPRIVSKSVLVQLAETDSIYLPKMLVCVMDLAETHETTPQNDYASLVKESLPIPVSPETFSLFGLWSKIIQLRATA